MLVYNLALAALLAAGSANANALNGDDVSSFDPAVAASRSLKRRTVSRVAPIANAGDTSGILVQEDIYASVEPASVGDDDGVDDDGELVSAFAAATAESPCGPGWKLLWNDEFKFDKLDKNAWSYLEGDGTEYGIPGWGNGELQTYTKSSKNVLVKKGELQLIARRDKKTGKITSGAVRTYKKVAVAPAGKSGKIRVDVTMKMPRKTGLKPFVQMLPDESPSNVLGAGHYGDWSQSGAIINAQRVNTEKGYTGGILYGGVSPTLAASTFKVGTMKGSTSTHTYSTEWSLSSMKFFQDSKKVYTAKNWYTNDTGKVPAGAPFDKPFYLMLAMSAGGDQTGATGAQVAKTLRKPQSFKIEYVQICEAI